MASRTSSRAPSRSVSSASLSTRRNTLVAELSPAEKEKAARITAACSDDSLNLDHLVQLATSTHGLVNDELRRTVWPLLLGCDHGGARTTGTPWRDLPPHADEGQVALDVNRAFVYYPKNETDKQLDARKADLSNVIVEVLRRHPSLCYFQGYHDIVQVFLLVLGGGGSGADHNHHDAPSQAVARLSLLRIRDFMLSSLDPALAHLELLHPILQHADPGLYAHLPKSQPSFALAGTITMFAHNIQEYRDIARLFDFFLAHHTVMPIYFFAAVVLSRRDEMLDIEPDDVDIMHAILGKLPQPFDVEFHIARAVELYERLPPDSLGVWSWWRISAYSVLKTSRSVAELRGLSLDDGERLFRVQEQEVRRQQALKKAVLRARYFKARLWYYRRPGMYGLAIAVGVYALWLGRNGASQPLGLQFGPLGSLFKRVLAGFL
ncbi:hypothetical protein BS50DRAFT_570231 [Corynespora cassiicola Philippines]|uniref:Rab-GAP TBC domain-containing protein n=1 Tax=Corynespora cassiicola Philippines TaxID=1448308 RepID=A0A2T2NZL2_CORCC|nr:hypothetical protein BS50DRAFT_570231 [Corynespora cassiicola Philippines]